MSRKTHIHLLFLLICSLFFSCHEKKETGTVTPDLFEGLSNYSGLKYAKRFAIKENKYCKVIYVFGKVNIHDTTATYILLKDTNLKVTPNERTFVIKHPCTKIASLSSIYTTMLCQLNELSHIVAIENIDYYTNKQVIDKFNSGELKELNKDPELDIERTIVLKPDILFTFGMGNSENRSNEKIIRAGIPSVIMVDHLEESPLARAEWIKFFGAFVNKENLADSLFNSIEQDYMRLHDLALTTNTHPTVFTEIKYGEIWYVPGGKSFAATFIKDAGGHYIWENDIHVGSLSLGFEEVFVKAKNADFWLNMALIKSKAELISQEPRYKDFKAYQTGNLYNNIKNTNKKNYSDYWETGILFPNKVLSDLILILHPELKNELDHDLYYYKKIE